MTDPSRAIGHRPLFHLACEWFMAHPGTARPVTWLGARLAIADATASSACSLGGAHG
jgi:hypothetical protein